MTTQSHHAPLQTCSGNLPFSISCVKAEPQSWPCGNPRELIRAESRLLPRSGTELGCWFGVDPDSCLRARCVFYTLELTSFSYLKKKKKSERAPTLPANSHQASPRTYLVPCALSLHICFHPFCISAGGSPGAFAENTDKWNLLRSWL